MAAVSRQLALSDGRRLGYDEHGAPTGRPIFLFHGTPGSRYDWYLFGSELLAQELDIYAIVPDRPGMGLSDFQPGRAILDWPATVARLADHLGLDRFAVLGYSGGGSYVAACALQIPERLSAAGVVSGAGPYAGPGAVGGSNSFILRLLSLIRDRPELSGRIFRELGILSQRLPRTLLAQAMAILPKPDRTALSQPHLLQAFLDGFGEALHPGPRGVSWDVALMISPWGFDPHDIAVPVQFWHGEGDRFVFPAKVRYLAGALPKGQITFYPGEGHVSALVNHAREILRALATH